jgi:hypothetical protein
MRLVPWRVLGFWKAVTRMRLRVLSWCVALRVRLRMHLVVIVPERLHPHKHLLIISLRRSHCSLTVGLGHRVMLLLFLFVGVASAGLLLRLRWLCGSWGLILLALVIVELPLGLRGPVLRNLLRSGRGIRCIGKTIVLLAVSELTRLLLLLPLEGWWIVGSLSRWVVWCLGRLAWCRCLDRLLLSWSSLVLLGWLVWRSLVPWVSLLLGVIRRRLDRIRLDVVRHYTILIGIYCVMV